MQYIPGTFNDTVFTPIDAVARIVDFGKEFNAGQFFRPSPQIMIGWASNWQYTEDVPTDTENWRSVMTLPRKMSIRTDLERIGNNLSSYPYTMNILKGNSVIVPNTAPTPPAVWLIAVFNYSSVTSGAIRFEIDVSRLGTGATGQLVFNFSSSVTQEYVAGGYHFDGDYPVWIDRARSLTG